MYIAVMIALPKYGEDGSLSMAIFPSSNNVALLNPMQPVLRRTITAVPHVSPPSDDRVMSWCW